MKAFDFKLFNSLEVPHALPENNIVFVTGYNFEDGVGDLVNMKDLALAIKKIIAGKGYLLYGVAKVGPLGKEYLEKRMGAFNDIFDRFFVLGLTPTDDTSIREHKFFPYPDDWEQQATLAEIARCAQSAACEFAVPYLGINKSIMRPFIQPHIRSTVLAEYGDGNSSIRLGSMSLASMGLTEPPTLESFPPNPCYGIKVNKQNLSQQTFHPEKLVSFKDLSFVKSLINHDEVTLERADAYLRSHELMVAYPQSLFQTHIFTLIGLYRNLDDQGKLKTSCDFVFPKKVVSRWDLERLFNTLGIYDYEFISQDRPQQRINHDKPKVRIFTPYIKDDNDYEALYFLQPSIAGPSGNSTFSTCLESHNLPFVLWFGGMRDKFATQLLYFIKQELGEQSLLHDYFKKGFKLSESRYNPPMPTPEHFQITKDLALLSKNVVLLKQWQTVKEKIIQDYNYYDNLPSIVKGTLSISNKWTLAHDQSLREAFLEAEPITKLIQAKLISRETILSCDYSFPYLEVICDPLMNDLLLDGVLEINDMRIFNKKFIEKQYDQFEKNNVCCGKLFNFIGFLWQAKMRFSGQNDEKTTLACLVQWRKN